MGPLAKRPVAWTNSVVAWSTASCFSRGSGAPPSNSFTVSGGPLAAGMMPASSSRPQSRSRSCSHAAQWRRKWSRSSRRQLQCGQEPSPWPSRRDVSARPLQSVRSRARAVVAPRSPTSACFHRRAVGLTLRRCLPALSGLACHSASASRQANLVRACLKPSPSEPRALTQSASVTWRQSRSAAAKKRLSRSPLSHCRRIRWSGWSSLRRSTRCHRDSRAFRRRLASVIQPASTRTALEGAAPWQPVA